MVLNPHSNWLVFSLYDFSVFWVALTAIIRIVARAAAMKIIVDIFIFLFFFLIGN